MTKSNQVREAVAVFSNALDMEAAIDELLSSGFSRAEISLLAASDTVRSKLGHAFTSTRELEDDTEVPTIAYTSRESVGDAEGAVIGGLMYVGAFLALGPVVASGGTVVAAILATVAGAGGGGAIGSIFAGFLGNQHARHLEEQIQRGGILLWVRTRDKKHEEGARDILSRHSGEDVHIHGISEKAPEFSSLYEKLLQVTDSLMETSLYHDIQIITSKDGHCYALGRIFATEAEAKRFIAQIELEV